MKSNICLCLGISLTISIVNLTAAAQSNSAPTNSALATRIDKLLAQHPIIDGHNDLPWEIRDRFDSDFRKINLNSNTAVLPLPANAAEDQVALMTDIPRLRTGHVGGQFWSVWIPVTVTGPAAVKMTIEQIDLVKRMAAQYPKDFAMAYGAEDIERNLKEGRIASLIGIEGGHQIDNSMSTLRQMYDLGARYMTLTHTSNTDWADSATDNPTHHGLTAFGKALVHEMNRLGMLVDLSHVSPEAMKLALDIAVAPVIFSHSGARALIDHPRDVPDDVLKTVATNHGIVMVTFCPPYISQAMANWEADLAAEQSRFNAPPFAGLYIGQPERAKAALDAWKTRHPAPKVTISAVADHIDHIRKIAGVDCVGIGSDFDGIEITPAGLDGVDKYPKLFEELALRGWNDDDLVKLASGNILRVLRENAAVAKQLQLTELPSVETIKP
jgi:membrane dipeptidase